MSDWKPRKLSGNPCNWQWDANQRVYEALGLDYKSKTIPKSLHGTFKVDGWRVVVKRSEPRKSGTGKHRVFIESEGRLVPLGRVRQALCLRRVQKLRKFASARRGEGGRFNDERGEQYRRKRR